MKKKKKKKEKKKRKKKTMPINDEMVRKKKRERKRKKREIPVRVFLLGKFWVNLVGSFCSAMEGYLQYLTDVAAGQYSNTVTYSVSVYIYIYIYIYLNIYIQTKLLNDTYNN